MIDASSEICIPDIEKRCERLEKFEGKNTDVNVVCSIEREDQIVEIQINHDGEFLRVEEKNADLYASIDLAMDRAERQLRKEKERLEQQSRVEAELLDSLNEVETKIKKSEIGFERQNQIECDALKGEIIDAAVAQGYEVVESETSQGVQLQFIRRDY